MPGGNLAVGGVERGPVTHGNSCCGMAEARIIDWICGAEGEGSAKNEFEMSTCVLWGGITVEIQLATFDAGMTDGKKVK
ncbi:hypothetical protein GDR29_14995 [Xanthomonas oryzae pv. oryzae]|nr:hypothetical protein GDR29_14995 [Xanthomonas oryzae pv. oryzae]